MVFGCSKKEEAAGRPGGGGRGGGSPFGSSSGQGQGTAIPVDVASAVRRDISSYIETNGTLEAENEVDIVARTSGPIVALETEEGRFVKAGQVLARIDPDEIQADLEIAKVNLEEARAAYERARAAWDSEIISKEAYDTAKARFDTAAAQIQSTELLLSYTEIKAPFSGLIVERAVKFAEFVGNNQRLFRISDFDPLLCQIQIPEKDLSRVRLNQPGYLKVESYPDEPFVSRVLRISPVVDAGTGTFKVTLTVNGAGKLRPGMFASVFIEADRREAALVVPRRALVLESVGDTMYVFTDGLAERRDVDLGFTEAEDVEVLAGISEGERVIIVGQDAVSDGTPVYVLADGLPEREGAQQAGASGFPGADGGPPSEEQLKEMREKMKARGMPEAAIDAMIERRKAGGGSPGPLAKGPDAATTGRSQYLGSEAQATHADDERRSERPGLPPGFDPKQMTEEQEGEMRTRMKARGLSDEQIDQRIEGMKKGELSPRGRPVNGGPPSGQEGPDEGQPFS